MLHQEQQKNVRRAWTAIAAFVVVLLAIGYGIGAIFGASIVGVIVAAVVALALGIGGWLGGDRIVLRLNKARPVSPHDEPRLHNIVEGLATNAGVTKPRVYVIDEPVPNAFSTGRDPAHASIAVTRGMLDTMNRVELEAVLAHEISHVKSRDTLAMSVVVTLVGLPATVLPFIGPILRTAAGRSREFYADLAGVQLTRYPPGLISALEKMKARGDTPQAGSRATEPVWIRSPLDASGMNKLFDSHPTLDERIKVLREL